MTTIQTREQKAWSDREPVMGILPNKGYQDNEVVGWLLSYVDETLSDWQDMLANLHLRLDPAECPDDYLDYVAYLFGLSYNPYWVRDWLPSVKRAILLSQAFLKKQRGTLAAITKVLSIHGITHCLWQDAPLLIPFKMPGKFGKGKMRIWILLPSKTARGGNSWREAARTLKGYCPAVVESKVAYQGFILGRSKLGEPIFPSGTSFLNKNPDGTTHTVVI